MEKENHKADLRARNARCLRAVRSKVLDSRKPPYNLPYLPTPPLPPQKNKFAFMTWLLQES